MAWGTQQGLEIKVLSGSHCPCVAQQTPVYLTFALPSSCNFFCSPFKYQTLASSPLKCHINLNCLSCSGVSFSWWRPCMYIIKFDILLLLLKFLHQLEEHKQSTGKFFSSPTKSKTLQLLKAVKSTLMNS